MKKLATLFSVLCLSFTMAFAEENPALNYEAQNVNDEFAQLNKIEQYVQQNEGVSLEELKASNSELVSDIAIAEESSASFVAGELPLGVPAFWWGCVLTILGVVLVYVLTDQDKDQTKKALYGCLVTGGVYVIYWVVWVAVLGRAGYWF